MLRSRVFLAGQAVSMLGDGLAILAVPLLVLQLTRSPLAVALASLPGSIGYVATGLAAGVLVDRMDPWLVLIASDVLRGAIFLALFAITGSARTPAWLILSLAFAAGTVTVFADTALAIAVRDVFGGPALISANSWLESANQIGQILGPGAAGLLAGFGLLHLAMLLDALTFGVSLVTVLGVRGRYRIPADVTDSAARVTWRALRGDLVRGLRYLAATRLLATLMLFVLVLNLCLGADKLVIFFARDSLRLPEQLVGLVLTAGGAGGLVGAASTTWLYRRLGPLPALALTSAASGAALITMGVATSIGLAAGANFLYTWAIIGASIVMRSLRQLIVPRELLGRITASWRLGGQAVTLIGGLLAGVLASAGGHDPRPVFAGAGVLTLATVAVAWFAALAREDLSASVSARIS